MVADKVKANCEVLQRYARLQGDIFRQNRIIQELKRDGHRTAGAQTLLRLLQGELEAVQQALRDT